jgi:PAS domain S-box-containing protein
MFTEQVEQAARRANELQHRARLETHTDQMVDRVIEALQRALAELEIATEALREQSVAVAHHRANAHNDRRRCERLLSASPSACMVTDAGGAIAELNAAAVELLGHDAGRLQGKPITMLVTHEERARFVELGERAEAEGAAATDLFALHGTPHGRVFTGRVTALADADACGTSMQRIWMIEDLSAIEDAKFADRIDEELRGRDEFLRALGHELRNPLAPVRSAVELWRHHAEQLTPAQRVWTMEVVSRSADHLAHLVDDLLDVSRLAHGKIRLDRTRVDLRDILECAYEAMRSHAQLHEVAIATPGAPVWVEGDPTRLRQVVANLFDNALAYTPKGRRIVLRVGAEAPWAMMSVWDEGVGLPADRLEAIFGMFAGPATTLARNPGRLGLGLPLVRQLIELHGGSVHARSEGLGQGAEFVVRLPLATGVESGPLPATESQIMRLGRRRLLVVDDNVDAAELLTMLLETEGHEVTLAFDGASAIASFQRRAPDVVLLDIGLPDMDGLELARRLHACGPHVPLVALTGYGDEATRARTRAFGFAEHLLKPVDFERLRRVLFEVGRNDGGCGG